MPNELFEFYMKMLHAGLDGDTGMLFFTVSIPVFFVFATVAVGSMFLERRIKRKLNGRNDLL